MSPACPFCFLKQGGSSLVFIDDRENVLWTRHVDCWGDDQAIEMARKEEESHFGVQVWDGERPVCLVGNPRGNAAMLD
jgi:hypothetical protein